MGRGPSLGARWTCVSVFAVWQGRLDSVEEAGIAQGQSASAGIDVTCCFVFGTEPRGFMWATATASRSGGA
jgi:hypothetical protein